MPKNPFVYSFKNLIFGGGWPPVHHLGATTTTSAIRPSPLHTPSPHADPPRPHSSLEPSTSCSPPSTTSLLPSMHTLSSPPRALLPNPVASPPTALCPRPFSPPPSLSSSPLGPLTHLGPAAPAPSHAASSPAPPLCSSLSPRA
jgi:hypothetical protein